MSLLKNVFSVPAPFPIGFLSLHCYDYIIFVTARQRSCGRVMFSALLFIGVVPGKGLRHSLTTPSPSPLTIKAHCPQPPPSNMFQLVQLAHHCTGTPPPRPPAHMIIFKRVHTVHIHICDAKALSGRRMVSKIPECSSPFWTAGYPPPPKKIEFSL